MNATSIAEKEKQIGNELYQKRKFEEAILHYNIAIENEPENHIYYSNKSACLVMTKKFQEALTSIQKCLEIKPDFTKGIIRLATIYEELKQPQEAINSYQQVLQIEPNNEIAFKRLDELLRDEKKVGEWYKKITEINNPFEEDKNELLTNINELNNNKNWERIICLKDEIENELDVIKKAKELLLLAKAMKELKMEYRSILKQSIELYPFEETLSLLQSA
ncbi:tetratricopeptide repeat containing protein [Entamoeba histolytica HM-1:IMSS-B]|uniref:Uncharacterized protein n=6 Tax=Entamoeba histolytica TaxID=5759 RepID=C4LT79_ENTH1|nr:uncharacterized protein EHI_044570 [Entamoeba histolytica HM-1:IMSS]EMD46331.1 heat shock protein (HSP70)interacting protein, putative [Entamoeba histolytica KU27]EMH78282.1 tetratricopeptide repeat containing protein [Entamoeba histolytica HM-1:IMSS-B]EMS13808.1 heat shock protein 70 (HSP70)-interacting protein [Entamoeba histolytica HM-3:IMSS]ENY61671.1 heat shock protein 70 (HSP70)-interacting protein, putative [Entamoeba histolytica HM-1:IMSS-A]GAT91754.1 hypothetical protein conserved |eukprot:XP_657239.1 uncharacterized protein EHI_044570 [Entamoeba histolytica HM-1:IMSS]